MITMNQDIQDMPIFFLNLYRKELVQIFNIKSTNDYNHFDYNLNHFLKRSFRKNNPKDYKRFEHLKKLILMPAQMNLDLETMGEDAFLKKWGIPKYDLVFSRKKWREGYYD